MEKQDFRVRKPELLVPAGNFEKLKTAILYGADAVYLAGSDFGMRSAAGNFTDEALREAVNYAHERGVRVYITVNTMPHWYEFEPLERYLRFLSEVRPDALIVADLGVAALVRELLPDTALHVSTQAGVVSHADCIAWYKLGASRIVLARELTLDEIRAIRSRIPADLELEAFIHGSMCVSYSGRCLLSEHLTGRDANRGMCTQPCRWNYKLYEIGGEGEHRYEIEEEKRPGQRMELIETDRGVFVMSSRDLCLIEHIDELADAGIASFKIEGRMKSAYYAALTANTYRIAIDAYAADPDHYQAHYDPRWLNELESVSHRIYDTGYFFDRPGEVAKLCVDYSLGPEKRGEPNRSGYIREKAYIATALTDSDGGNALFIQRNKICAGEGAALLSPGQLSRNFVAESLWDEEGQPISSTPHPGMKFRMAVPFAVHAGDIVIGTQSSPGK